MLITLNYKFLKVQNKLINKTNHNALTILLYYFLILFIIAAIVKERGKSITYSVDIDNRLEDTIEAFSRLISRR